MASTVHFDGLAAVLGTRWVEPTRREPASGRLLVPVDGPQHHMLPAVGCLRICDRICSIMMVSSIRICSNVSSSVRGVAPISSRHGGSGSTWSSSRRIARRRRRSRLRVTAGASARPTANATAMPVGSGFGHHVHQSDARRIRVPSRDKRWNDWRSRTRRIKPKGGRGPWRAGS